MPIDHRYYVPESADYKSIDIEPGYQLMRGHDALDFVRYRHDQRGRLHAHAASAAVPQGDAAPVRPLERGLGQGHQLIKAITSETTSDIDSSTSLAAARRAHLPGRHVQGVHGAPRRHHADDRRRLVRGAPPRTEIDQAVAEFTTPVPGARRGSRALELTKKMYPVTVFNGSGIAGPLDHRGEPADRARLPGRASAPTPPSSPARSPWCTRPRASQAAGTGHRRHVLALGRAPRGPGARRDGRHQRLRHLVVRRLLEVPQSDQAPEQT